MDRLLFVVHEFLVLEKVADDSLFAGAERDGFQFNRQGMQSLAESCNHASCKGRVVIDALKDDIFWDKKHAGIGAGLHVCGIGPVKEHYGLGEALAWSHDPNDVLLAANRKKRDGDPAGNNDIKA